MGLKMKVSDKYSMTAYQYCNTTATDIKQFEEVASVTNDHISSQLSMPSDRDHHKFSGLYDC